MKKLRGAGDWEDKLKVLEKSDVRALNERELNQEEQDEQYRLRQRLGIVVDDIQDERVVVQVAAIGEGQQRPSWIWFTGGGTAESMNDPLTRQGMLLVCAYVGAYTDTLLSSSCRVVKSKGPCGMLGRGGYPSGQGDAVRPPVL